MHEMSGLDVRVDRSEGATVVRLRGDLDLATSGRLQRAATDDLLQGLVILDLAALSFCDSSGLRVLLDMHRRATGGAAGLRLAGPSSEVDRMFELSGTREYFDVYPDVAAALAG
jgi:anti-sigma B factor antagonist